MKNYITILAVIAVAFLTSCNIDSRNEYTPQISTSYFLKYQIDANNADNPIAAINAENLDLDVRKTDTLTVDYNTTKNAWELEKITLDAANPKAVDIYFSLGFNAFTNDLLSLKVEISDPTHVKLVYHSDISKLDWKGSSSKTAEACSSIDIDEGKYSLKFKPGYNYGAIPVFYQIQPGAKDKEISINVTLESDSRYSPATLKLVQEVK